MPTFTSVSSQTKFSRLREEHAELIATSASTTAKLERTTLQRDGAQAEIADLERLNVEFKRNNVELKRQLDKWQNLETKGGDEVETLRRRRIELEVQVKEFEGRLADADKIEQDREKALEKEKKKVEKLKGVIDSWRVRLMRNLLFARRPKFTFIFQEEVEDSKKIAAERESEAAEAKKQLSRTEKQLQKLQTQLEADRKKTKLSKSVRALLFISCHLLLSVILS